MCAIDSGAVLRGSERIAVFEVMTSREGSRWLWRPESPAVGMAGFAAPVPRGEMAAYARPMKESSVCPFPHDSLNPPSPPQYSFDWEGNNHFEGCAPLTAERFLRVLERYPSSGA